MLKSHVMLGLVWMVWCGFHSLFITPEMTGLAERLLGERFGYYRLGYSLFSVATVLPVVLYEYSLDSPLIFSWSGPANLVRWPLLLVGVFLGISAGRLYGPLKLFGLRVLLGRGRQEEERLITRGILGVVRHPLYLSGVFILWTTRDLTLARLVTSTVLSSYLIAGSLLEERKLAARFRGEYIEYARRVPRFFPSAWLKRKILRV